MTETPTQLTRDLHDVLELTATQAKTKARIDLIRERLSADFKAQLAESGIAPTWKLPNLGSVRLDGFTPKPVAYIKDTDAFTDWVAQRYPTEVTATITLDDVTNLEDALAALEFAGIKVAAATVTARPTATDMVLGPAELIDGEPDADGNPTWDVVDDDGELIPGAAGRTGTPTLVVSVDAALKKDMAAAAALEDHDNITDLDVSETPGN